MDLLHEYRKKEKVQRSLKESRNIMLDESFMSAFSSDQLAVIVLTKKQIEKLWSTNLEYYNDPRGSFFCNKAYANMIKFKLSEVTQPDFSHRGIGLWPFAERLRIQPKTFQNALWVLYSGVRRVDYKCTIVDRNGVKTPVDAQFHVAGDTFCYWVFAPTEELSLSFSVDDGGNMLRYEGPKMDSDLSNLSDGVDMKNVTEELKRNSVSPNTPGSCSSSENSSEKGEPKKRTISDPSENFDALFSS